MHRLRMLMVALFMAVDVCSATMASADGNITNCEQFCRVSCTGQGQNCREAVGQSAACKLADDIVCSSVDTIRLFDGTDLDMAGFDIVCGGNADCGAAVRMEAAYSAVYNSDSGEESVIAGRFQQGVNCQNMLASTVTGIAVEDAFVGVLNCNTITKNVIRKANRYILASNHGIIVHGVPTSGPFPTPTTVTENYIEDRVFGVTVGASLPNSGQVVVERNVVNTSDRGACGVWVQAGSSPTVSSNVIQGNGVTFFNGLRDVVCFQDQFPNGDFSKNVCDKSHPQCAACQSRAPSGTPVCAQRRAPFPDANAASSRVSLRSLGTAMGGSATSIGWTGAGHGGESPEGSPGTVELRNCLVSGGSTSCEIHASVDGRIASMMILDVPGTGQFTSYSTFETDLTGVLSYEGGIPVPVGVLEIQYMELTADQRTAVSNQVVTCDGIGLGAMGHCQGGSYNGTEPCLVEWTGDFGNTSSDCLPSVGSIISQIDSQPMTISTGTESLSAAFACSNAPNELCHCEGGGSVQSQPNACTDYDCTAGETCLVETTQSCFPATITRAGSVEPLVLVGVGCATVSNSGFAAILGAPGPVAITSAMEVVGLP